MKALEPALSGDLLLQLSHALLVTKRVGGVRIQVPGEVLVGVVGLKVRVEDAQALSVVGNLGPVTLDVLQIAAEVRKGALEDLAVHRGSHDGLDVDVLLVGLGGLREDVVGSALDGAHELLHLVWVGGQEGVVGDVEDRAEAAAAEFGELVNTEHLNVIAGTVLRGEPLGQLDHLHVLETDTGVDVAADDGLGDVHAAANGSVVVGSHAVVLGELIDLDL